MLEFIGVALLLGVIHQAHLWLNFDSRERWKRRRFDRESRTSHYL